MPSFTINHSIYRYMLLLLKILVVQPPWIKFIATGIISFVRLRCRVELNAHEKLKRQRREHR